MNTQTMPSSAIPSSAAPANETTRKAAATHTLSPRFYTTDVAAMNRLRIEPVREAWKSLMAEFEADENRGHFQRDPVEDAFDLASVPEDLRAELTDFLVSSLTAEFSGCVLYAELYKKGLDPDLRQLFKYMARDESRHAGFINDHLREAGLAVDMSFLVREKDYTYFSPKHILYATYLSEKIGYARYICIYRQLERHPELRFHPIFRKFERWCEDEFRHGEALALVMRANPALLSGVNLLWIRFFQLAVFSTMFVRDHGRPAFHRALGLDPEAYGMDVFRIVQDVSRQVFPVLLDIESPAFLAGMRRLNDLSRRIEAADERGGVLGKLEATRLRAMAAATFARLYLFLPTRRNALPSELRMAAAW